MHMWWMCCCNSKQCEWELQTTQLDVLAVVTDVTRQSRPWEHVAPLCIVNISTSHRWDHTLTCPSWVTCKLFVCIAKPREARVDVEILCYYQWLLHLSMESYIIATVATTVQSSICLSVCMSRSISVKWFHRWVLWWNWRWSSTVIGSLVSRQIQLCLLLPVQPQTGQLAPAVLLSDKVI